MLLGWVQILGRATALAIAQGLDICMPLSEILLQLFPTLPYKWHGRPGLMYAWCLKQWCEAMLCRGLIIT